MLAGQRIQVYTSETVDTLAKESIAAYSSSEHRRMLRRMAALLAAILIPVLVRRMTPQPVSGFERTYWDYQALYHFDDTDIGQLVAQYQLNGEPLNVFASYLVRWGEDGKILSVGEDSFQVVLQISAKEADKERSTDRTSATPYTTTTASPLRNLTVIPSDAEDPRGSGAPPGILSITYSNLFRPR